MTTKTFTVTVSNPGSGNKYYIDGALQATVSLARGATYRFDQSDSSNAGHPLRFSTTSDGTHGGGSAYVPGITVNGTPGSAGAYTEFFVTEVGPPATMYYYCTQHSGMGGSANLTSNSWGALSWSNGVWGNQGHIDVSVTGQSLTSSIGTAVADAIIEIGWGGDTWGENEWGDLSGSQPTITGIQATFSIGSLQSVSGDALVEPSGIQFTSTIGDAVGGTSALVSVTGSLESMAVGQTVVGIGAIISGISMTSSIGTATVDETTLTGEGWGRGEWGEFAWGDNFSVQVTGQSLTSSIGNETAFTDVTVSVTSAGELTSTFASPSFSIQVDQDIFVLASEDQLDASIGSVSNTADANIDVSGISLTSSQGTTVGGLKTPVPVTGSQASLTQGNITLIQSTNESVTGIAATMTLGQHAEIPGQIIGVSGLSITSSLGEEGISADGLVIPTGQSLTSSVGSVNITAWSEIDLGVNNTWTEVDLAA